MTPRRCADGASAARSFIQLAKRRYASTTTTHFATPLDFLIPRNTLTSTQLRIANASFRLLPQPRGFSTTKLLESSICSYPIRRCFTTSAVRRLTKCIQNPQTDEDGNEMMVEITPRAAKRMSDIMKKDSNPNLALRIQVESGGCHGFQYLMSLITIPAEDSPERSSIISEDDTIFQFTAENDADTSTISQNAARVVMDEPSLDLLKGSKVDFTMELIGSQFKIVDNPYATSSCGCGTSFDIKM